MKSRKKVRREARQLLRLCRANGSLDEGRIRRVIKGILESKRRGHLALADQFEREVRLDQIKHTAEVKSATPLSPEMQTDVRHNLVQVYGPTIETTFTQDPELIGGMRIRAGDDVYDGSIKARLAALEQRF
jgi:F-type H+-transporting ATPase subunit delta